MSNLQHRSVTRKVVWGFAFLSTTLLIVALHSWWLPVMGAWLDVGETPVHTDYVLVLNGDMNTRPFVAAALVKQGFADQVVITQVKVSPQWEKSPWKPEHEIVREIQLQRGVPADQLIVLESACDATRDEALVFYKFMQSQPAKTATIVTSNYHTRRTRWVFREVFGQQSHQLHFVSAPTDFYNASNWWRMEESFVLYLQECMKFAFYWVYHGRGWMTLVPLVGCIIGIYLYRRRVQQQNLQHGSHDPATNSVIKQTQSAVPA
jgi:uncharacterized SAM-binding protein YcdF (DUF218 family)